MVSRDKKIVIYSPNTGLDFLRRYKSNDEKGFNRQPMNTRHARNMRFLYMFLCANRIFISYIAWTQVSLYQIPK